MVTGLATFCSRSILRIWAVASKPFMTGMSQSISITSNSCAPSQGGGKGLWRECRGRSGAPPAAGSLAVGERADDSTHGIAPVHRDRDALTHVLEQLLAHLDVEVVVLDQQHAKPGQRRLRAPRRRRPRRLLLAARRNRQRELERDGRTDGELRGEGERAAEQDHELAGNVQAEARARDARRRACRRPRAAGRALGHGGAAGACEGREAARQALAADGAAILEDGLLHVPGDADAGVGDLDSHLARLVAPRDLARGEPHLACRRELDGIPKQVEEDLREPRRVRVYPHALQRRVHLVDEAQALLAGAMAQHVDRLAHRRQQLEVARLQRELTRPQPRRVEQVVDQVQQQGPGVARLLQLALQLGGIRAFLGE
mmetsp:Transcript_31021/g.97868  ORF Transcript_31021/g.97868 Transcript_31021/m.97868 type:complete len:372 (-) Transcript_31021:1283-2398(-)